MITTLTVIHIIVCVLLILMVLLQFGKGAEAGLFGGTGSDSVGSGRGNVLTKITTVLATAFLVLSLVLANLHGKKVEKSLFDDQAKPILPSLPVAPAVVPSPAAATEAPTTTAPATK